MWEEDSDNNISDNALTLNLQAYGADGSASNSSEGLCIDTGTEEGSPEQRSRKRKRSEEDVEDGDDEADSDHSEEVDMPDVVHQMEAEIERQLDSKAKKSNLTVANVKNILKDVITNEHVLDLVRHTMKQPEKNFCISKVFSYAPKLTRAKTRELLNTFPSMAWPITPNKNISNSKCKVLIEQELPEDSSDEEYQPDEDDDEKHKQDSSFGIDPDEDDEDEQAESDEADAQGDEEDEDDDDDDDEEEEDEIEDEQDSDKNDGNKIQLNVQSNNVSPGEDDDDIDDDECRLVICDNDNDLKETPLPGNLGPRNVSMCKHNHSKKAVINNTATQTSWPEVNGKKTQNRLENSTDSLSQKTPNTCEENICQRTRSKLSLSDTPLETIESAFIPPDITTDMYDSECDDEDWKNFLKGFTEPLKPDTQDAPDDDENDPEYNIMADEEETDDKEEHREDPGVKVSRKEVNALMAELFEYIGMLSDENEGTDNFQKNSEGTFCGAFVQRNNEEEFKDIAEHIAGALEQHTEESVHVETPQPNERVSTPLNIYPSPESLSNEKETTSGDKEAHPPTSDNSVTEVVVKPWEMPHEQRMLIEQQMRMYVQFQTQHFLLTYLHPLYHVYSIDCKQNLLVLKHHAKFNKSSTYYPVNLDDALVLIERWEHLLSSADARRRYLDFMDAEIEMQNMMKRRKQFYRGQFPPGVFEIACNSSVFMYPALLPTNPFRCDGHTTSPFLNSEDHLIALGLEHFKNYAKSSPKVLGKVSLPKIVPMIVEHFVPARRTNSVYTRILECTNSENNPIKHFIKENCVPRVKHYVLANNGAWIPPCQQPLELLPDAWREYIISKRNSNICGNV